MASLPADVIVNPTAPHSHTVIFLHGRGDTAQNFSPVLERWRDSKMRTLKEAFPSFRWVFPSAPVEALASFPVQKVSQWFDIWNSRNFFEREELQAQGLRASVAMIRSLLGKEVDAVGGDWKRIIVMGISQGAATAVHTILNTSLCPMAGGGSSPRGLGAFLGFSCRMPFPRRSLAETRKIVGVEHVRDDDDAEVLRNTPVLLEHCVNDPTVRVEDGRELKETLLRFGADVTMIEYPDGGHWFHYPNGLDDVIAFVEKRVVPETNAN